MAESTAERLRRQGQTHPTVKAAQPPSAIEPGQNGDIVFPARLAKIRGDSAREEIGGDTVLVFHSPGDEAFWEFHVEKPGFFKAELTYALTSGTEDAELDLILGERVKHCSLRSSGGLDRFHSDTVTVAVPHRGNQQLVVRAAKAAGGGLVLKEIRFMPISAKLTTGER